MKKTLMSSVVTMLVTPLVWATQPTEGEPESLEPKLWSGEAELGYIRLSGNSESETMVGKAALKYAIDSWENKFNLEAFGTSTEQERSAERYKARAKTQYALSDSAYTFLLARYEKDRFGGYDYQASGSAGYGRTIIKNDTVGWTGEVGPGYRTSETTPTETVTAEKENELVWRLATDFQWQISQNAQLTQKVETETGDENTSTFAETALTSLVIDSFNVKFAYVLNHNTHVAGDNEKLEELITVSLTYKF